MTAKPSIRIKTLSCVCGHCHLGGECLVWVGDNPCGCLTHETEAEANQPMYYPKNMITNYEGIYHKGWHAI